MNKIKWIYIIVMLLAMIVFNCKSDKKDNQSFDYEEIVEEKPTYIEIITKSMEFQMPDTISSGWNTFKYINKANETHFFRFLKLPDSISIENYKKEVDPVFEEGMDLINLGKAQEGFGAFAKLPEWFSKTVPYGGSGLIAPKHETIVSLKLDSGNYIVECYVKMPNGKFHSTMGMIKAVYVKEDKNDVEPPKETLTLNITDKGIIVMDSITKGEHIMKVAVKNQKLHENYALSDVHLVRLSPESNLDSLGQWMVWYNPKGFITPVPNGITFLGGFNDATEGSIGYFIAELTPGNYAFISEVPNAMEKGMLKTFTVE